FLRQLVNALRHAATSRPRRGARRAARARGARDSTGATAPALAGGRTSASTRGPDGGTRRDRSWCARRRVGARRRRRRTAGAPAGARGRRTRRTCGSERVPSPVALLRRRLLGRPALFRFRDRLRCCFRDRLCRRCRGERFLLALTRDVVPRGGDDRPRALRPDAVDVGHALLVGLRELLGRLEPVLIEELRREIADVRDRRERRARPPGLVLGLGLAAHVELPGGEARR